LCGKLAKKYVKTDEHQTHYFLKNLKMKKIACGAIYLVG
jgi:hypothetical protein